MAIQHSVRHLSTQFFHTAVAIGAVMLACQAQAQAPRSMPEPQPQAKASRQSTATAPRLVAQAAPQQQQPLFDRDERGHHGSNDRDRKQPAPRAQPANAGHDDRGGSHGDRDHGGRDHGGRDHGDRDHGHDMNHHNEGPRGRPPVVRPPIHPHPPHPVIVVPPCKRGGPGITPC
ncbi:hypothetical protein [uncultured Sphaerotilus sp.]|uniref:hypothetical protein n=1 Tax=uncultured Sphaerotilus sp. TaxID=474984 RepID=UPI0030CA2077